ncbi:MAG: hypothetical protein ACYDHY_18350 [Acidiferrobacterales bacterium]
MTLRPIKVRIALVSCAILAAAGGAGWIVLSHWPGGFLGIALALGVFVDVLAFALVSAAWADGTLSLAQTARDILVLSALSIDLAAFWVSPLPAWSLWAAIGILLVSAAGHDYFLGRSEPWRALCGDAIPPCSVREFPHKAKAERIASVLFDVPSADPSAAAAALSRSARTKPQHVVVPDRRERFGSADPKRFI